MKNRTESIKAKLKNVSKEWNKNHQLTLIRYFQERFLYRLSISKYRKNFFLKGGVLIYAIERESSRPTLDLDLLARKIEADQEKIKRIFQEICSIPCEEDGVSFDGDSIETLEIAKEGNYSGIRAKVLAILGNIEQRIQIDTGFGDIVVPGPVKMTFPTLIGPPNPELLETKALRSGKKEIITFQETINTLRENFVQDLRDVDSREEFIERMQCCYDTLQTLTHQLEALDTSDNYFRTKIRSSLCEDVPEMQHRITFILMNV